MFAVLLLVGIISIFKSYPSLGDFALWHALLATYSELVSRARLLVSASLHRLITTKHTDLPRPLLLLSLTLYALLLLPTFHHLWLYSGSGNANFFYASTLVWALAQGGLLVDCLGAYGRREVLRGLGVEGREKVRAGEWGLVQI